MDIKTALRTSIEEQGLSHAEVAVIAGVRSDTIVRRWLSGRGEPSTKAYRALCARLPGFERRMREVPTDGRPVGAAAP